MIVFRCLAVCFIVVSFALQAHGANKDIVIADFEGTTYGDWIATGTAFRNGPARGDLPAKLETDNYRGNGAASSEIEGDGPTGTLTSPPLKIARRYISFLIGGGKSERHTCLNLLVDGQVVHSATGWNSDRLVPVSWDLYRSKGRSLTSRRWSKSQSPAASARPKDEGGRR